MLKIARGGRAIAVAALSFVTLGAAAVVQAQTTVDRWLVLGPATAPLPFGAASTDSARVRIGGLTVMVSGAVVVPASFVAEMVT